MKSGAAAASCPSSSSSLLSHDDEEASVASILNAKRAQRHAEFQQGHRTHKAATEDDSDTESLCDEKHSSITDSPTSSQGEDIFLLGRTVIRKKQHHCRECFLAANRPRHKRRVTFVILFLVVVASAGSLSFLFGRYALRPRISSLKSAANNGQTRPRPAAVKEPASANLKAASTSIRPSIPAPTGPRPHHSHTPATDPIPFVIPPPQHRRRIESLDVYSPITSDPQALEQWIAKGRLPSHIEWPANHTARKHDVVIASVNGTDWEHVRQVEYYYAAQGKGTVQEWWQKDDAPRRRRASPALAQLFANPDASIHRFREIDELRYAVRSAHQNLQDLRNVHILTPSFSPPRPFDAPQFYPEAASAPHTWEAPTKKHTSFVSQDGTTQWGQVPQWLNLDHAGVRTNQDTATTTTAQALRLHHDWDIWTPNWLFNTSEAVLSQQGWTLAQLAQWRHEVLPTFNSIAMESNLGHEDMSDLAETFIYSNDDMFYGAKSTAYDFATPLYGPVLRLDNHLLVRGRKDSSPNDSGEWPTLRRSAWLLDQRFGGRARPYTVHEPKTFNAKLLREMRMMWPEHWRVTAEDRFRSEELDRPGSNTHFLMAHFLVERHREALLWSFIVAKMDENGDGRISGAELQKHLLTPMGLVAPDPATFFSSLNPIDGRLTGEVRFPFRSTMDSDTHLNTLARHGFSTSGKSKYDFLSADGYPFMTLHPFVQEKAPARPAGAGAASGLSQLAEEPWPRYHPRKGKTRATDFRFRISQAPCRFPISQCFSEMNVDPKDGSVSSDELFKKVAFQKGQQCGDCLIVHLLGQSGDSGFEAFLPSDKQMFPDVNVAASTSPSPDQEPHLPLTNTWSPYDSEARQHKSPYAMDEANFSLSHLASTFNTTTTTRSLREFSQRLIQRYTYTLASAPVVFERMQFASSMRSFFKNLDASQHLFLCLNDDYGDAQAREIKQLFTQWARRTWNTKSPWEV